ncbi:siderophore ABC transporter substrate-binding protein [Staphylococcus shinii]|uniref:Transferrin-binding protein n=1 Tax=Staphylococcus shinii TaxID=2912228 RepID=A0A418IG05_9STAP|nr:ABC transporter substrate-binding protein [Staphylococcus shinii]MDW8564952.1 ABC transporter substrate-binding protein [Staphylococcus shinii]MDW8568193.1 ABC transporter substrate-binding protein [Staphylococcus shinii]RIN01203.1 transferrin-binding protein [Staphylococcus shinii]
MNKFILIALTTFCFLFLGACSNAHSDKETKQTVKIKTSYEFKDKNKDHNRGEMKHEVVEVPVNPKRVVVMDYGALDVMQQLKLENHIVAIAKGQGASFLPDRLKSFKNSKYKNLGNPGQPNYDELAKSKPDVIFASFRQAHTKTLEEMKKAAPNAKIVFISPQNDDYIASIKNNTKNIGKIFEKQKEAKKLVTQLDDKVAETKKRVGDESVLFLNVDDKGLKTYGSTGRFGGFLNQDLGIKHADKQMKANSSGILISNEYLNEINPDKLFVIDRTKKANGQSKTIPQSLQNDVIKNSKAIKNDDVTLFDANSWFFGEGGIGLTIDQLKQIQNAYK